MLLCECHACSVHVLQLIFEVRPRVWKSLCVVQITVVLFFDFLLLSTNQLQEYSEN